MSLNGFTIEWIHYFEGVSGPRTWVSEKSQESSNLTKRKGVTWKAFCFESKSLVV